MIDIASVMQEHQQMIAALPVLIPDIEAAAERLDRILAGGGKLLWMGNGGSAADSQHLAAELIGRFRRERNPMRAMALTTDTSILTALGNDYGFATIFQRQIEALAQPRDGVIGLSSSGNSPNILQGVAAARRIGAFTLALTGADGGALAQVADLCLKIPATTTARIQEGHILVGHILCDWLEAAAVRRESHP